MNGQWFLALWILGHILYSLGAIYYLVVSIPSYFRGKREYLVMDAPRIETIAEMLKQKGMDRIPLFKFQITTKGNEVHVVNRGIRSIIRISETSLFRDRIRVDVVTEEQGDREEIGRSFPDCPIPLKVYVVPEDYVTKNNTLKKARALQYMIERRQCEELVDEEHAYIVYFDSESVMEPVDFRRLVYSTIKDGKPITEGPISYPLRWFDAHIVSRQMEATRPWHCYHCHEVMVHPPPQHLHGSNLVVEEELAREFGWDFGNLDGQAFIAEDLIFGLKAYMRYGSEVFGWHGAQLLEQPPMQLGDSVRQRIRWVTGIWQGLEMLKRSEEFRQLPRGDRLRTRLKIGTRAALYSLGFFSAVFFFLFAGIWIYSLFWDFTYVDLRSWWVFIWSILLLSGLVSWLGSTQIGLTRILERMDLSRRQRVTERLKIFSITPVAALIETASAMYATMRWFLGYREVNWIPTKK